jgi:hypothetical protein
VKIVPMRLIRLAVIVALVCPLVVASAVMPAQSQPVGDSSFTGGIFDSFGAKAEATGGLHFDPIFAYVQSVGLEQQPLATGHGYVAFPGALAAVNIITCCGASPDYPRFAGLLPTENICGDPGNLKRGEPELRSPRNYGPPAPVGPVTPPLPPPAPYNTNCNPGPGCDVFVKGNPASSESRQEFANAMGGRATFASGYGVSVCDSAKLFAYSDQRVSGVNLLPVGTSSSAAPTPAAPVPQVPGGVPQPGGGLVPQPGASILPAAVTTGVRPQQTTVYAINMGSVTSFSKLEVLGPGLTGVPSGVEGDLAGPALATTGTFTDWLTIFGFLALAGSVVLWGLSRRIGGGRFLALIAVAVLASANVVASARRAESQQPQRIVGTVTSRANDVVVTSGGVEIFRVAEVTVIAVAEANGQPGGAKTSVTRTIRGVKVLGQEQSDVTTERIDGLLAATGLAFKLGEVTRTAESNGSSASVEATGILLQFETPQDLPIGGGPLDPPKFKLTLAKATPSVSFFSLASILGAGGVDFGAGITQEFSGTEGELSGAGGTTGGTFATPQDTSVPGVKQVGPGQYVLEGKFAGFDFEGMKIKLWPLKDILEAAGGILLIIAVVLAVRHRRRFAAPKPA